MNSKIRNFINRWIKNLTEAEINNLAIDSIIGETPYDTARQVITRMGYEPNRNDRILEATCIEIYRLEDEDFYNRLTLYSDSIHLKFICLKNGFADSDVLEPLPPDAKTVADFISENSMLATYMIYNQK